MKYLIKLCVVVLFLSMTTGLFAQEFRIKAGLNVSGLRKLSESMAFKRGEIEMKNGFHAGATAEFPIAGIFSFETGILVSTKGFKETTLEGFGDISNKTKAERKWNTVYLEIPVTAKASVDIGKVSIYGLFGPYIARGIAGTLNYAFTKFDFNLTTTGETDVKWGNNTENDDFRKLDFGLTMGAGLEIHPIQIGFTYGLGLANILPLGPQEYNLKNKVLGFSIGFKFGKK